MPAGSLLALRGARFSPSPSNQDNQNSEEYLEGCLKQIIENLRHVASRPSVQMQRKPSSPAPPPHSPLAAAHSP